MTENKNCGKTEAELKYETENTVDILVIPKNKVDIDGTVTVKSEYLVYSKLIQPDDLQKSTYKSNFYETFLKPQEKLTIHNAHVLQRAVYKQSIKWKNWKTIHLSKTDCKNRDKKGNPIVLFTSPTETSILNHMFYKKIINEKGETVKLLAKDLGWEIAGVCLIPIEDKFYNTVKQILAKNDKRKLNNPIKNLQKKVKYEPFGMVV